MRMYRMKYNLPSSPKRLPGVLTIEWFASSGAAGTRRGELRKQTGRQMAFETDRFNVPTKRDELAKFLTDPESFKC